MLIVFVKPFTIVTLGWVLYGIYLNYKILSLVRIFTDDS